MRIGRPKQPVILSNDERSQLEKFENSRSLPHAHARRARIVLLAAGGESNKQIAEKVSLSPASVGKWRTRFLSRRINGLYDEIRPGRPRSKSDEEVAEMLTKTLEKPVDATHWSCRRFATEVGVSKSTVQRLWKFAGIKPHRIKEFKLSTDPFFVDKVRDIVGLYLNPPDKALVLCVDEKSQCQALERTQPGLPMGLGYAEGFTHDYIRHGTTTLFAALNVATGDITASCKARHRHQEFLQFLRLVDVNTPAELDLHIIMDNYATHKHEKVRLWLAKNPRFHVHFTPTYSSWLNQVERWFGLITQQAIRRGSFTGVKHLVRTIDNYVTKYNSNCKPFVWVATADSILEKVQRLIKVINGTLH